MGGRVASAEIRLRPATCSMSTRVDRSWASNTTSVTPDSSTSSRLARAAADVVVSLEQRRSEVTDRADVVLPVAPVINKAGTFRNWERRDRRFATTIDPSGGSAGRVGGTAATTLSTLSTTATELAGRLANHEAVLDNAANLSVDDTPATAQARAADVRAARSGVVAVEEDPGMAAEAEARLAAQDVFNVAVVKGPLAEGCPGQGPYDAILIEGAIEELPQAIADQLREGGRIIALFKEGNLGVARLGQKTDGRVNWRFAFNAAAPALPGFLRRHQFAL